MKQNQKQTGTRLKWLWILLIQALAMLIAGVLFSLSIIPGGIIYKLCIWVLMPLTGFAGACIATRLGLLNYAAWLVPPVMEVFANLILWGYSPALAPVFLCGFISLVGAATGEVLKQQNKHQRR